MSNEGEVGILCYGIYYFKYSQYIEIILNKITNPFSMRVYLNLQTTFISLGHLTSALFVNTVFTVTWLSSLNFNPISHGGS